MAVGIALIGHSHPDHRVKLSEARDWLARAAVWFEAVGDAVLDTRLVRDAEERPLLQVSLHPVVEPVELRIGGSGRVKVSARTSPAGPGYHAHLVALLKQFATHFAFTWDPPPGDSDPARYFLQPDREKLEHYFLHWLAAQCATALRDAGPKTTRYTVGMPRTPSYKHPGPVLTPLGPRSVEWLRKIAADAENGRDFFPWWEPDLNAEFYTRRAMTDLWLEFHWRAPLTESEGELVDQIAADLANAYALDPKAELPWPEWNAVVDAITNDRFKYTVEPIPDHLKELITQKSATCTATEIGYRRQPIVVTLQGGWQLTIPGHFAVEYSDETRAWTARDALHTIWFQDRMIGQELSTTEALDATRNALPPGEPLPRITHGEMIADAVYGPYSDDTRTGYCLRGVAVAAGRLAVCHIYQTTPEDRAWAIETWESLRHSPPESAKH